MYKVRIVNTMYGYQSDRIVNVEASSLSQAMEKAQAIDMFAEVYVVEEPDVSLS